MADQCLFECLSLDASCKCCILRFWVSGLVDFKLRFTPPHRRAAASTICSSCSRCVWSVTSKFLLKAHCRLQMTKITFHLKRRWITSSPSLTHSFREERAPCKSRISLQKDVLTATYCHRMFPREVFACSGHCCGFMVHTLDCFGSFHLSHHCFVNTDAPMNPLYSSCSAPDSRVKGMLVELLAFQS